MKTLKLFTVMLVVFGSLNVFAQVTETEPDCDHVNSSTGSQTVNTNGGTTTTGTNGGDGSGE